MTPETKWLPSLTAPEGEVVMTKIDDSRGVRNEQPLRRRGNLWFSVNREKCPHCKKEHGGDSMYVYYTPTHWRPIDD
jgi:hypothetical protein